MVGGVLPDITNKRPTFTQREILVVYLVRQLEPFQIWAILVYFLYIFGLFKMYTQVTTNKWGKIIVDEVSNSQPLDNESPPTKVLTKGFFWVWIPLKPAGFFLKFVLENKENKQNDAGDGPF